jgi:hypothetical protein
MIAYSSRTRGDNLFAYQPQKFQNLVVNAHNPNSLYAYQPSDFENISITPVRASFVQSTSKAAQTDVITGKAPANFEVVTASLPAKKLFVKYGNSRDEVRVTQ